MLLWWYWWLLSVMFLCVVIRTKIGRMLWKEISSPEGKKPFWCWAPMKKWYWEMKRKRPCWLEIRQWKKKGIHWYTEKSMQKKQPENITVWLLHGAENMLWYWQTEQKYGWMRSLNCIILYISRNMSGKYTWKERLIFRYPNRRASLLSFVLEIPGSLY